MPKESASILIENGTVVTVDPTRRIIEGGTIAIRGDRIADVGPAAALGERWEAEHVINAAGMAVLPGLINSHTHCTHNLLRGGLSQDRNLYDWLLNVLYAGLAQYSGEDAQLAAKLYCMEAIHGGITTSVDNADFGRIDELAENTIETYQALGVRAVYARMFYDHDPKSDASLMDALERKEPTVKHAPDFIEDTDEALASMTRLMQKYHRSAGGRVQVWPSPGIPMFLTADGMLRAKRLAREHGAMLSTHIAESPADAELHGVSAAQYLSYLGYLGPDVLAGHCVWMKDRDIRLLKKHEVRVSNLAVSNQYLASGIAPIAKMINQGITVGIGTDDTNCNDSANMLSDMKHVALLQKVGNLGAGAITAEKVLEMATIDGARAVGMEDNIGSIEVGTQADIVVIDLERPHMVPCHHIPSVLVYQANGSEVDTTVVAGRVLMEGGRLTEISTDEERATVHAAQEASVRIAERAGMRWRTERGWPTLSG